MGFATKNKLADQTATRFAVGVASLRNIRKKAVSPELQAVADRMRAAREAERFSQYDLADHLGVSRTMLSNVELFQNALSFSVGFEFCRRLNIMPRWLRSGDLPKRPFVPLTELKLATTDLEEYMQRGVTFVEGYQAILRQPTEAWLKKHSHEEILARAFTSDPSEVVRKMSTTELTSQLDAAMTATKKGSEDERSFHFKLAELLSAEMGSRLEELERKTRR